MSDGEIVIRGMYDIDENLHKITADHLVLVSYKNKVVPYSRFELSDLDLFYASTVHKCQGSQFKRVYAINSKSMNYFCDKKWLYTALSRAESNVIYLSSKYDTKLVQERDFSSQRKGTLLSRLKQGIITSTEPLFEIKEIIPSNKAA